MQKPSIPKGTRDFSPEEMAKRNYIFNTIRDVYHSIPSAMCIIYMDSSRLKHRRWRTCPR